MGQAEDAKPKHGGYKPRHDRERILLGLLNRCVSHSFWCLTVQELDHPRDCNNLLLHLLVLAERVRAYQLKHGALYEQVLRLNFNVVVIPSTLLHLYDL